MTLLCSQNQSTFFTNDNPLWQFLSLVLAASIGILTVYIQNTLTKKSDKRKLASEISSEAGRIGSLLISRYRAFVENYSSSSYFYACLPFFTNQGEKDVILSNGENAKADWKEAQREFQQYMAEYSKLLHQFNIHFGSNEEIKKLLAKQRTIKLAEKPDYSKAKTNAEVMQIYLASKAKDEETIRAQDEVCTSINAILVEKAKLIVGK